MENPRIARAKFLSFARRLALVTTYGSAPILACGGGSSNAPPATLPSSSPSSSTGSVPTGSDTSSMATDGPCRCSWDTNASSAPRVCKKGEPNYEGVKCIPGTHPTPIDIEGPLPPPDLVG